MLVLHVASNDVSVGEIDYQGVYYGLKAVYVVCHDALMDRNGVSIVSLNSWQWNGSILLSAQMHLALNIGESVA